MEIFQNLRQLNLANQFENKLITNFVKLISDFDINKLVTVPTLPGSKSELSECSKHCKEKVQQFGSEIVYGIQININDNNIYRTFHCI